MFRNHKRLYFFTGKGGVGKTSFALALTKFLEGEGVNVAYFNFDQSQPQKIISLLQVPTISQTTEESAQIYIEGKLGSRTVANWILKTTFFKSLLNITPSIGYMISLGHIINRLENDPSLTIVIDAPASGHTLSLFNSTHNFKEMFKVGPLVEDIYKMHNFLKKSENIKVCILCLPNIMNVQEALELKSGKYIFEEFKNFLRKNNFLNKDWNALNFLPQNASTVGLIDLKIISKEDEENFTFFDKLDNKKFKLLYLLGSDNLEIKKDREFIIYQGSHGDKGAEIADVILPSAAFTEQNGLYENLEGRIQECKKASYPIGEALEDWKIFNLILKKIGKSDKLLNFEILRSEVLKSIPNFSKINELPNFSQIDNKTPSSSFVSEKVFVRELDYFYTNSISRASKTMSECRQVKQNAQKTGTDNI